MSSRNYVDILHSIVADISNSSAKTVRFDGTVGTVAEQFTAALRVPGSIPTRSKYFYSLQVDVPGLAVCVCDFLCF